MLKKLSCTVLVLAVFALGLTGGYFLSDSKQLALSEAHAGDCVSVITQYPSTSTGYEEYSCGYVIHFTETPAKIKTSGKIVQIYFE